MTELVAVLVAGVILVAVGWAGYLAGRDGARREAGNTIATLRRRNMALVAKLERTERAAGTHRRILGILPDVHVSEPGWMREGQP
jgi:hypothetical protein